MRNPWVVVVNLVLVGILFIVAEAVGRESRSAEKIGFFGAVAVGLAQAAALVPGVSRSGATITVGLFSFLMSVPIIAGAGSLKLFEAVSEGTSISEAAMFGAGFVSSAMVGYLAIRFLLNFLTNHTLRAFAYYRFTLAAVVAVFLSLRILISRLIMSRGSPSLHGSQHLRGLLRNTI